MDQNGWYLCIIVVVVCLEWLSMKTMENSYRKILYAWASIHPVYLRSGDSMSGVSGTSLMQGVRSRSAWLARQASLYGMEEARSVFERYVQAFESGTDLSESRQALTELVERAHKLSLAAKSSNNTSRFMQIANWRSEVSTWAEVVSRFVPKIVQRMAAQAA